MKWCTWRRKLNRTSFLDASRERDSKISGNFLNTKDLSRKSRLLSSQRTLSLISFLCMGIPSQILQIRLSYISFPSICVSSVSFNLLEICLLVNSVVRVYTSIVLCSIFVSVPRTVSDVLQEFSSEIVSFFSYGDRIWRRTFPIMGILLCCSSWVWESRSLLVVVCVFHRNPRTECAQLVVRFVGNTHGNAVNMFHLYQFVRKSSDRQGYLGASM